MTRSITDTPVAPKTIIPGTDRLYHALTPLADVGLRVAVGTLLIPHGAQKLFGWFGGYGLTGTAGWFDSIGFTPGLLFVLLVGGLEFFGGLALTVGFLTRPLALAVAGFMGVAFFIHLPNGYVWVNSGGGFEVPLLWGLAALVLAVRGGGRYSVDHTIGREF